MRVFHQTASATPAQVEWARVAKRLCDLSIAITGGVVFGPLLAVAAVLIRLDSPGPVFYAQLRSGFEGRPFRLYKLRTMVADADSRLAEVLDRNIYARSGVEHQLYKIRDDPRVTRTGRWLRRFAIDELPQLFNVLRGEMSVVGPRPLTLEEDVHVQGADVLRATMRPGITGLWQVTSRNRGSFEDMMRLDREYVTNWSFHGDLALMARTVPAILYSEDYC